MDALLKHESTQKLMKRVYIEIFMMWLVIVELICWLMLYYCYSCEKAAEEVNMEKHFHHLSTTSDVILTRGSI